MKNFEVTEVKAVFEGISGLPQKENLTLNDIQESLPNVLKWTALEADTYEVTFIDYFRIKAVVYVKSAEDKVLSYSPIASYSFFALFEVNHEKLLVSFSNVKTIFKAKVFMIKVREDLTSAPYLFVKHEISRGGGILVQRQILSI